MELHTSSAFSVLEAASQPESLVRAAVEKQMPAMALLDRNGLYGAARFHTCTRMNGIQAHIGSEVVVDQLGGAIEQPLRPSHQRISQPARLSLLCESRIGYQNLCQLITRLKLHELTKRDGSATLDDVSEFSTGLLCLTDGEEGLLAAALQKGGGTSGKKCVEQLIQMFGHQNVYVELQRHGCRAEEACNQAALRIAESLNLPVLATNGVRYATQYKRKVMDVLTSVRHNISLDKAGRLLQMSSQRQVKMLELCVACLTIYRKRLKTQCSFHNVCSLN